MRRNLSWQVGAVILSANLMAGCDQLGLGKQASGPDGAPDEQELQKISYMTSATGTQGRKLYNHYEEAKTCGDFELAMRWNRPPNRAGGPFDQKMVYLTANVPPDFAKDSEVFIAATIEKGETLPSGSAGWYLRMQDGTLVQAIEAANYWEKEEQAAQDGKVVAIVRPEKPGRAFCGQGVYEGLMGKDPTQDKKIPLVALLFAMDRDK